MQKTFTWSLILSRRKYVEIFLCLKNKLEFCFQASILLGRIFFFLICFWGCEWSVHCIGNMSLEFKTTNSYKQMLVHAQIWVFLVCLMNMGVNFVSIDNVVLVDTLIAPHLTTKNRTYDYFASILVHIVLNEKYYRLIKEGLCIFWRADIGAPSMMSLRRNNENTCRYLNFLDTNSFSQLVFKDNCLVILLIIIILGSWLVLRFRLILHV